MKSSEFRLADGLPEFLDELADRQIPMTIATASMEKNVQFFFEHLGLDRWFSYDQVALNDGTMKGKPEPDIFLRAAELMGVRPEECMVFEDAKSGIEAARRAGACRVVGVASMQEEETLRRWGDTAVIRGYLGETDGAAGGLGGDGQFASEYKTGPLYRPHVPAAVGAGDGFIPGMGPERYG